MIGKTWNSISNLGVQSDMYFAKQRALRVFNGLSFLLIPISPLMGLLIANGKIHALPFISNCVMAFTFIAVLFFNHLRHYNLARALYFIVATWVVVVNVYYFGGKLHLELTFLALFITAFAFSHRFSQIIFHSLLTAIGYMGCILITHFIKPVVLIPTNPIVQIIFSTVIFLVAFASLWMIRSQHEQHEQIIQENHQQLLEQKEEIEAQHSKIISTRNELETKNTAITSSINYAQRIQQAILPSVNEIQRQLPDSFIFYKPRDIVSGDFYWHLHFYQKTYFAVADCTGHGVPGAFMSMLGSSLLNLIVQSTFAESPKLILKYLDLQITQMLARGRDDSREGMEIVLGILDKNTNILKVASTNRPYFLFRNGSLEEFKGSKGFIGKSLTEKRPFEEQVHEVKTGDCFYFFTDGLTDQFDENNKKKYSIRRLREFVSDIHKLEMHIQHSLLDKEMDVWRGETPQTDDMLMMGIRF